MWVRVNYQLTQFVKHLYDVFEQKGVNGSCIDYLFSYWGSMPQCVYSYLGWVPFWPNISNWNAFLRIGTLRVHFSDVQNLNTLEDVHVPVDRLILSSMYLLNKQEDLAVSQELQDSVKHIVVNQWETLGEESLIYETSHEALSAYFPNLKSLSYSPNLADLSSLGYEFLPKWAKNGASILYKEDKDFGTLFMSNVNIFYIYEGKVHGFKVSS